MGVLNVTPDSFSDGGQFADVDHAVAHAQAMLAAGAGVIDLGGESTRPGAAPVTAAEELARLLPVLERLVALPNRQFLISIDTTKAAVAAATLAAGAHIVNDVTALRGDPAMAATVRAAGAGLVLMHMQGTPRTMQQQPQYADVVAEVREFLRERVEFAVAQGVPRASIAVDPGIGFGKTVAHNLALLARLAEFKELGCPLVVGTSRKSFIGKVLAAAGTAGGPERAVDQREWGTAATVAWAVAQGARVVRVHEVAAMADVVRMVEAIGGAR
jgi:dihydropteroate synthase